MALIEVKDLYKIYNPGENEVRALDGVSLTIDRGEFVAIIGHSGSGKSTFMNMLGLLDVPTSGEYKLDGHNTSKLSDDEMSEIRNKEIGFIFQGFNLISSLTAQENVELPLAYRGMPKAQRHVLSEDALKRVGLEKRMNHLPKQMSGGQQQRVAIARAVAAKPPIILADEPTGNLDQPLRSGGYANTSRAEPRGQNGYTDYPRQRNSRKCSPSDTYTGRSGYRGLYKRGQISRKNTVL